MSEPPVFVALTQTGADLARSLAAGIAGGEVHGLATRVDLRRPDLRSGRTPCRRPVRGRAAHRRPVRRRHPDPRPGAAAGRQAVRAAGDRAGRGRQRRGAPAGRPPGRQRPGPGARRPARHRRRVDHRPGTAASASPWTRRPRGGLSETRNITKLSWLTFCLDLRLERSAEPTGSRPVRCPFRKPATSLSGRPTRPAKDPSGSWSITRPVSPSASAASGAARPRSSSAWCATLWPNTAWPPRRSRPWSPSTSRPTRRRCTRRPGRSACRRASSTWRPWRWRSRVWPRRRTWCAGRSASPAWRESAALAAAGPEGTLLVPKDQGAAGDLRCRPGARPDRPRGRRPGARPPGGGRPRAGRRGLAHAGGRAGGSPGERPGRLPALSRPAGPPWRRARRPTLTNWARRRARVSHALDLAAAGRRVALVCSGDPGIYAMASPLFELLEREGRAELEPGGGRRRARPSPPYRRRQRGSVRPSATTSAPFP